MPTFKDTKGREWELRLTLGIATRIREATGVKVLMAGGKDNVEWSGPELMLQPEKFADALWLMIAGQAEAKKIERADFEDAFDVDVYRAATAAFIEAATSFSPLSATMRTAVGSGEEVLRRMEQAAKSATSNSSDTGSPGTSV